MPLALSGGQQQRTAIARALVKRADLVLLDEPLANLDYKLREELREELPRIFEVSGADLRLRDDRALRGAAARRPRRSALSEGRVLQFGDTPTVYRRPDSLASRERLLRPAAEHRRDREDGRRRGLRGRRRRRRPSACYAGLRRTGLHRRLPRPSARRRPAPRRAIMPLPATVAVTEITGSESFVHLDVARQQLGRRAAGRHEFPAGPALEAALDPDGLFVFDADGRLAAAPAAG